MKKPVNIKKIILPNLPYLLFALLGTKCGQAARLAPGLDFSQKALHILDGFRLAFTALIMTHRSRRCKSSWTSCAARCRMTRCPCLG